MDFAPPVAQNVNVNPNQGLQTLSNILGLKQQQQQLQIGQAGIQTAQAEAQQQQQTAQQRQHIAGFLQNFDPEQHMGPDGTLDLNGIFSDPDLRASFGDQFPAFMQTMQTIKQGQLTAKQQLLNLNNNSRVQFEQMVGGLRTDPDVIADNPTGRQKVQTAIGQFASSGPDAARAAQTYGSVFQNVPKGKLAQVVSDAQLQSLDASAQAAHQAPTFENTGAALVPTNPQAAGGNLGPTPGTGGVPAIRSVIPPGITAGPGGTPIAYGPGGAGLPQAGSAPPGKAPAPPPTSRLPPLQQPGNTAPAAQWQNYNAQMQAGSQLVTAARNAANDPMNGVNATRFRNQQILDLIPDATTGPGLRLLNTLASRLPGASGDAYQDIEHYTALNSAALAQKMGVPNTNLGSETSAAAAGNVERNPGALAEITKTNDALNTAFDLFNRGLARVANNGSDPSRVPAYQQAFGSNLDINAIRWADAFRRNDTGELRRLQQLPGFDIGKAQKSLQTLKALSDTGDLPQ